MIDINKIDAKNDKTIVIGDHPFLIQSILDFDYLCEKDTPSVIGIITGSRGFSKYFYGKGEVLIPNYASAKDLPDPKKAQWFLNLSSGRRALSSTLEIVDAAPNLLGGAFFAENVPEMHSIELYHLAKSKNKLFIGPASVGLLVPGALKLGAIAGVLPHQLADCKVTEQGKVAVMAASGGMTIELITIAVNSGEAISYALSFGGDRFPILSPQEALLMSESHKQTKVTLYYGELGGDDEYQIIELKKRGKIKKPVIFHIAGTVADLFPQSPQFGHAKAKASKNMEKALVKRQKLREAGFFVTDSFADLSKLLKKAL